MIDFTKILSYNKFAIQCHDNPDADALACAYAFAEYLKTHGKDAEIVYGGFKPIVKSSLLMLLSELQINARYLSGADKSPDYLLDEDALLIVVDGQCDAGNVKKLVAANVAAIDHHVAEAPPPPLSDIRPSLGSCSTLVWVLLK
ncbi:MAG: DHH family phosphoesterase, partial [Firmicutes bacterium]|nr:DHH family phosphoesterase [Bacillota bacterium]